MEAGFDRGIETTEAQSCLFDCDSLECQEIRYFLAGITHTSDFEQSNAISSSQLERSLCRSGPFNPFTADPVKALHFAVLV